MCVCVRMDMYVCILFLSKHCHRCQSLHLKTFSQKILIRSFVMQRCVSSATAHLKASGVEKLLGLLDVLTLCRFLCLRCPIRWNKHHGNPWDMFTTLQAYSLPKFKELLLKGGQMLVFLDLWLPPYLIQLT